MDVDALRTSALDDEATGESREKTEDRRIDTEMIEANETFKPFPFGLYTASRVRVTVLAESPSQEML